MKKTTILLCASVLLCEYSSSATTKEVTLVGGKDIEPVMWIDDDQAKGLAFETAEVVFKDAGYTVKKEAVPWARAVESAKKNSAFIVGFSKSNERLKEYLYTDQVTTDEVVIIVKSDKVVPFKKASDLKGFTLGHLNGADFGPSWAELMKYVMPEADNGGDLRIRKILNGRIQGGVFSFGLARGRAVAKAAGFDPATVASLGKPIVREPNYVATGKGTVHSKEIIADFNRSLKKPAVQKEVNAIIEKYNKQ